MSEFDPSLAPARYLSHARKAFRVLGLSEGDVAPRVEFVDDVMHPTYDVKDPWMDVGYGVEEGSMALQNEQGDPCVLMLAFRQIMLWEKQLWDLVDLVIIVQERTYEVTDSGWTALRGLVLENIEIGSAPTNIPFAPNGHIAQVKIEYALSRWIELAP